MDGDSLCNTYLNISEARMKLFMATVIYDGRTVIKNARSLNVDVFSRFSVNVWKLSADVIIIYSNETSGHFCSGDQISVSAFSGLLKIFWDEN